MKKLLIAITYHKFNKEDIYEWSSIFNKQILNYVRPYFLFDKNLDDEEVAYLKDNNILFYNNGKNTGKANLVINFLKSSKFDEKFIKLVDPDDSLNLNELKKFVKEIQPFDDVNFIINSNYFNMVNNKKDGSNVTINTKKFSSMMANQCTILNIQEIQKSTIDSPNITKSSDTILAFIATSKVKTVVKIDNDFYYYNYRNGISNVNSLSDGELKKYYEESKLFIEFIKKYNEFNYLRDYPCSPGHITLEWGWRSIKRLEKNYFKKVFLVNKLYNDILLTTRSNEERQKNITWNFWKRLRYILF